MFDTESTISAAFCFLNHAYVTIWIHEIGIHHAFIYSNVKSKIQLSTGNRLLVITPSIFKLSIIQLFDAQLFNKAE